MATLAMHSFYINSYNNNIGVTNSNHNHNYDNYNNNVGVTNSNHNHNYDNYNNNNNNNNIRSGSLPANPCRCPQTCPSFAAVVVDVGVVVLATKLSSYTALSDIIQCM